MYTRLQKRIINECRSCNWIFWVLLFLLITHAIASGCSISNTDLGSKIGVGGDTARALGLVSQSCFQSETSEFGASPDTAEFHKHKPAPSQPPAGDLPKPPNPLHITLQPKFYPNAPNRTVYYVSGHITPFPRKNFGCANPTITRVINKSTFPIHLEYGPDTSPIVGETLNPNQLTNRFAEYDALGPWVALGPESGLLFMKWYSAKIEVSWTCSP